MKLTLQHPLAGRGIHLPGLCTKVQLPRYQPGFNQPFLQNYIIDRCAIMVLIQINVCEHTLVSKGKAYQVPSSFG